MIALFRLHGLLLQLMFWGLGQLGRLTVWLIKQPFRALSAFFKLTLAYVHMEVKRWAGLIMAGLFVLAIAGFLIHTFPAGSNWRLFALLLCLVFLVAFFKTLELTMANRLQRVRGTLAFREIHQMSQEGAKHAKEARDAAVSTAAEKTKGTPAGKLFRQNKDAAAAEQEQERLGAERAEAERIATAEQAVQDQHAAAERERRLEDLAAMEPSPYDD